MSPIRKKRGDIGGILVMLIIFVVVAIIVLRMQDAILAVLRSSGEDQTCVFSSVLNSATKVAGVETYNFKCPMKFINIGLKDSTKNNVKGVEKPLSKDIIKKLAGWGYNSAYLSTQQGYREYRANEIVAKELASCWNKMGKGEF